MLKWRGRVALVTGASAGIGAEISRHLTRHGMNVVACSRRIEKLEMLKDELKDESGTLVVVQCDLREEADILSMFARIREKFGRIDVCVNNAGIAKNAPLLLGETNDWQDMMGVNILALSICTRESVKLMREKNIDDGFIINVNSLSGHRVIKSPPVHFYSATKFAVRALSEGVRNELKQMNSNIRIASISPGMVEETEFQTNLFGSEELGNQRIAAIGKCLEPKDIADACIYILQSPSHVSIQDVLLRPTDQQL